MRRTNVATKLKLIYIRNESLDVRPLRPARFDHFDVTRHRSKSSTKHVGGFILITRRASDDIPKGDEWTDCFVIGNVSLPANPFLGFSAMTGDVSDAHEYVFRLGASSGCRSRFPRRAASYQ